MHLEFLYSTPSGTCRFEVDKLVLRLGRKVQSRLREVVHSAVIVPNRWVELVDPELVIGFQAR
jgi:hypothetical protein